MTGQNETPQNVIQVQKWYGWIDHYAPKLYKALKLGLAQVWAFYRCSKMGKMCQKCLEKATFSDWGIHRTNSYRLRTYRVASYYPQTQLEMTHKYPRVPC